MSETNVRRNRRSVWRSVMTVAIAVASVGFAGKSPVFASEPSGEPAPGSPARAAVESPQGASGYGDGGTLEVGVYYNNYSGGSYLPNTDDDALGFYNTLGAGGWNKKFAWGNYNAWENDWKRAALGGHENNWVDSVDFAFFSGHGGGTGTAYDALWGRNLSSPIFMGTHDNAYLTPGEAYRSYGDNDLEWAAFSACLILDDGSYPYWASTFYGMHGILGFKTVMWDVNIGTPLAQRIRWGWPMYQAWFGASDVAQPQSGNIARVIVNEYDCYFDKPQFNQVCADSYDSDYWVHQHKTGSEKAGKVDIKALNFEMPVFNVIEPLSDAAAELQYDKLGGKFGITETQPSALDGNSGLLHSTDGAGRDLTMDKQGVYYYLDQTSINKTITDAVTAGNAPEALLSPQAAKDIADTFLNANSLYLKDAYYYEVVTDTLSGQNISNADALDKFMTSGGMRAPGAELITPTVNISYEKTLLNQVLYSRKINYVAPGLSPSAAVTFSVQGPGARLKVFVDNSGKVIGTQGGWREVVETTNNANRPTVTVLDESQIRALYLALGDAVNLAPTTFNATSREILSATVGYYEKQQGAAVSQLIPVWILEAKLTNSDNVSASVANAPDAPDANSITTTVYIPASQTLLPPLAKITSNGGATVTVGLGTAISLTAADASKTLAQNGYDSSLSFSMGAPNYTYTWKLASTGRVLGTGQSVNYAPNLLDVGDNKEGVAPITVFLEVTDAAGQISKARQTVQVSGITSVKRVNLPFVLR